jgi:Sulfotransferase family/Aspartyl/Asparaginyl beta-hydroxylase
MHLPKPFFKLPCRFDATRLAQEVAAMPPDAWAAHPNGIDGNSSVRLISADGGENDLVDGHMRETSHIKGAPYVRQVLASFNVPWSRTRLLRLAPGAVVPRHADINYHWFYRVRLHIPILTRPEVLFHCDTASVHMAAGEAWVFDNWRLHHVVNPSDAERIHLVADTAGNAAFWQLVGSGADAADSDGILPFLAEIETALLTECSTLRSVMNPAEIELLVGNLRGELIAAIDPVSGAARLGRYHALLDAFVRNWRQCYMLHGEEASGWKHFRELRDGLRAASRPLAEGLAMRTNQVSAHQVLEGRVLRVCVTSIAGDLERIDRQTGGSSVATVASPAGRKNLNRPIIIVAAPRSGSSLLFETLASSTQLATLGGEAHWMVESISELRPGAPEVESNRLIARHASPAIIERIQDQILEGLTDRRGEAVRDGRILRFLEKTPKNAVRIPFLSRVFPDVLYVFLWREPRGSISSIMEAWRAGKWRTYPRLEGFALPWSLLLPPGWQTMRGRSLEEVAAFQWSVTNMMVLDDLSLLPTARWIAINYDDLIAHPAGTIQRICRFAALEFDAGLAERVSKPLPLAKHTLTPVDPQKWKRNEAAVESVLPLVSAVWNRLLQTTPAAGNPTS